MNVFAIILTNLLFVVLSGLVAILAYRFYNTLPLSWFVEYGDNPEEYPDPRLKKFPDSYLFCSAMIFLNFLFFVRNGFSVVFFCNVLTVLFFLYVAAADIKTRIIPDQFLSGIAFVSLFWVLYDISIINITGIKWHMIPVYRISGALLGGGIMLLVNIAGTKLLKQEALGMGDVKLIFACGLIVGYRAILPVIALSFLLAFPPSVIRIIYRSQKTNRMPFGPFIILANTLYLVFPVEFQALVDWWLKL
jgi:prepilin signal peptidase PulO-like enzyme (type II secretory pathway)